jgi:type III restriction enzyme
MELKPYQQKVIDDLDSYLQKTEDKQGRYALAFNEFWEKRLGPYNAAEGKGMEPYKDNVPGVPNVCIKVPTAGGKTFIACNSLKIIYDHYHFNTTKAVVWLVPGVTILEQTLKNLSNVHHPYRQRINTHFSSRVQVFDKEGLVNPRGFNPGSVQENLNIFILSFDTFRSKSKDNRKIYQENGMLIGHKVNETDVLEGTDETALINVIRSLNPVVIVDESHNAETELSIEMLKNLNPSFILDLTATPRNNSNIISYVDALELKKENMVKLPVIVYNHKNKEAVIESAINLRNKLEKDAKAEEKKGGSYIRPIVLFQAQPRTGEEQTTFEKIKAALIQIGIPQEEIKIKTADINELKNEDLMSRESKVRYIITVNALKEGWDCPFAYILASLADKSSAVDVEQIVGRILRQPYVKQHQSAMLNMSFVLTASAKFLDTIDKIVKGLNKAGFSPKEFKVAADEWKTADTLQPTETARQMLLSELADNHESSTDETEEINIAKVNVSFADANTEEASTEQDPVIQQLVMQAQQQNEALQTVIAESEKSGESPLPTEIENKVTFYKIKEVFREAAEKIMMPQFFVKEENMFSKVNDGDDDELLAKENLLEDFRLSKEDTKLDFEAIKADMYKIELEKTSEGESAVTFSEVQKKFQPALLEYFAGEIDEKAKTQLHGMLFKLIGNMPPISDSEIKKYLKIMLEGLEAAELKDIASHPHFFTPKIKEKIWKLADVAAEKKFNEWIDTDVVMLKEQYRFKSQYVHKELAPSIAKSLYDKEEKLNGFETDMASRIGSMDNVLFWHKNPVHKGFLINGFLNHYPDFIVVTKAGKIVLIETKGDHLDGSDSQAKIRLGEAWAKKAGNNYRYYMVFDNKQLHGAITIDEMVERLGKL